MGGLSVSVESSFILAIPLLTAMVKERGVVAGVALCSALPPEPLLSTGASGTALRLICDRLLSSERNGTVSFGKGASRSWCGPPGGSGISGGPVCVRSSDGVLDMLMRRSFEREEERFVRLMSEPGEGAGRIFAEKRDGLPARHSVSGRLRWLKTLCSSVRAILSVVVLVMRCSSRRRSEIIGVITSSSSAVIIGDTRGPGGSPHDGESSGILEGGAISSVLRGVRSFGRGS